jgi:hypothetical protein
MIRPNSRHTKHNTKSIQYPKAQDLPRIKKKKSKTNPQSSRLRERIHKKKKKKKKKEKKKAIQNKSKPIP